MFNNKPHFSFHTVIIRKPISLSRLASVLSTGTVDNFSLVNGNKVSIYMTVTANIQCYYLSISIEARAKDR
jgi:hypothetical protein